jgi:putative isomerase
MATNVPLSRREALAGIALVGATAVVGEGAEPQLPATEPAPLSPGDRKEATDRLVRYFASTATQLLRPAEGVLKHPSIAPSLPGKRYATSLWDWDTYWTTRGLFRLAAITGDGALHGHLVEHAIGSVLNFLDHQSDQGRIPMVIDVNNADPLGCLAPVPAGERNPKNQAKPVFAQLAQLITAECGSVDWLAPHFDKLVRFHDAWASGNQSQVGLLVWGNDVAIGNDNDPTTFGRPSFSSANLLLNCLFHEDLRAAAELARRLGRADDARRFTERPTPWPRPSGISVGTRGMRSSTRWTSSAWTGGRS